MDAPADFPRELVSLCMIVRDEAEKLPRCLAAAAPWVGEIVVVDTGSVDDTVAIATAHGARVLQAPWGDDFAAARNVGIRAATRRWALVLDADEELVVEAPEAWAADLRATGVAVHALPLRNHLSDGSAVDVCLPRVFDRTLPGARYEGRIHEQLAFAAGLAPAMGTARGVRIEHDGYRDDRVASRAKIDRNLRIARTYVAEAPHSPVAWWSLATSVRPLDPAEARDALRRCLELQEERGEGLRSAVRLNAFAVLAHLEQQLDGPEPAWCTVSRGLDAFPDSPDLNRAAGDLLLARCQHVAAERAFFVALQAGAASMRFSDAVELELKARYGRALALTALGRSQEAEGELRAGAALEPAGQGALREALGDHLAREGRWEEALAAFAEALRRQPMRSLLQLKASRCLTQLGREGEAQPLREAAEATLRVSLAAAEQALAAGEARQAAEALLQLGHAPALLLAGWAYQCAGHPGAAMAAWAAWRSEASIAPGERRLVDLLSHALHEGAPPPAGPLDPGTLPRAAAWFHLLVTHHRVEEIERLALRLPPADPAAWRQLQPLLARELAREGLVDPALDWLMEAHAREPDEPEWLYWIGHCAALRGAFEDARVVWEACRERGGPEPQRAVRALAWLDAQAAPGAPVTPAP